MRLARMIVTQREPEAHVIVRLAFEDDAVEIEAGIYMRDVYLHETRMPESAAKALIRGLAGVTRAPTVELSGHGHAGALGDWLGEAP